MSNALTIQNVEHELDTLSPQLAALLPSDVPLEKFRQVALAAIRNNPRLLNCDRQSLFNACLNAAQDGLMPDGREGAIVPRKGKAVWQPMVMGIYKRVKTSGSVATLSANVVYAGEPFDVLLGDEDRIVHRRDMTKVVAGEEVAVYAIATLKDGTKEREVMTWEQVLTVRQASATPNEGPWVQWPDEMARKTVVRRLAKRLPVLDPADEALHRTISRVDSLYDFGTAPQEAPPPPRQPPPSRRDQINAEVPLKAAAAPMRRGDTVRAPVESTPDEPPAWLAPLEETDPHRWEIALDLVLANCQSRAEVVQVGGHHSVETAIAKAPEGVKMRVSKKLADAFGRFAADPEPPDELPPIVGEDKIMAGDD